MEWAEHLGRRKESSFEERSAMNIFWHKTSCRVRGSVPHSTPLRAATSLLPAPNLKFISFLSLFNFRSASIMNGGSPLWGRAERDGAQPRAGWRGSTGVYPTHPQGYLRQRPCKQLYPTILYGHLPPLGTSHLLPAKQPTFARTSTIGCGTCDRCNVPTNQPGATEPGGF
jgi:hypothetical protein